MKREATSSPDDGPKKEKRKYIRKPKALTGAQPSGAEAPASSLMDVVWGDSSPVTNNGDSLPNPQVVPAIEKDEKGNTKGASAAGKVVKGKGKAGLDGKKGKQASDSGNDVNRDGEGNTLVEGKKSTAGPSRLGMKPPNLRVDDDPEEEEEADFGFGGRENFRREDPERMQQIFATMTEEQMRRYECFRRSGLSRPNLKRLMQSVTGTNVTIPMTIVMAGLSKMFVGDLVETAREVMTEWNENGPIRPTHIREALRRLKQGGKVPVRSRPLLFA